MRTQHSTSSQQPSGHLAYRPDIDGIRAIAVLAVVIFHAFPDTLRSGFIGVDMFFVISGFLITSIIFKGLDKQTFSFKTFYTNRIKRIFPALLTVLVVTAIAGWLILPADEYKQLGKHIASSAGFFSNFTLWEESGYFDTAAESKPLLHLWSLAIEEQFYIIWPLVLWFAWKKRINYLIPLLLLAGASFYANMQLSVNDPTNAKLYYSPQTRFWELWIGALLAYASTYRTSLTALMQWRHNLPKPQSNTPATPLWLANACAIVGTALLLAGFITISTDNAFPSWRALLPTVGTALMIAAGKHAWINRTLLANRLCVGIGLISFPLYLWHWPLLSFARIIESESPVWSIRALLVVLALVLAWLTKRWVEDPLRFGTSLKRVPLVLLAALAFVGLAGYGIYLKQGIPARHGITELTREVGRIECDDRKKNSGCVFGNPNADKLIILFGDSHAEHLSKAMDSYFGRDYKIHMITNGSCFMGNTFTFPGTGNKKDCTNAINTLKNAVNQPIYAVVRSQRWHGYGVNSAADIARAIDDTVSLFPRPPEKFVIVGSTADVDFDCEVANYYARSPASRKACKTDEPIKMINKTFIDITRTLPVPHNVRFVYPYPVICPNDACVAIDGTVANYTDTHHLSKDGAMRIMPDLAKALLTTGKQP